ncbi:Stk1 family PASTA domain-containing Ser/Thr kinase [Corynebacterium kutscheri]|uniref:non-specific serine/threonine protein kinase n=1 Tax=Corynebacterium kutscheri TaxID=35755 RepID=A0A0F6R077_9CORY|nr:Stk1 family PASTA domain-containing Ser/Thr kinase [Corynebacterium kutscheri]AKE40273.1 serine/threonine protein kinase [Corynebacterium kutscheri]VEH05540.1 Serine/threonine-protein kinase [Corynebacterium kutscheri]VEH10665.1 Serine/threonine-protein kinase [Corynebacterium kutscheri]
MTETIANRYVLGEIIGTGGMSVVFSAQDTLLGREVAVKMLRAELSRDINSRERFRKEALNSGRLNHPAIVAVYDTGEVDRGGVETPYIVMERVIGRTLRDIVRNDGALSPNQAAAMLIPVCQALAISHQAGIIHRDIKPANIMITNTGAVKIMDFGIARALDDATSAMTQTSAVIGTAQYLSPEQARGKTADARSDIYALGCVLYEMLTGKPPFQGESPLSVAYQHVQDDPAHPSESIPGLTPTAALNVDAVVLTAMAKHPGDRYQSAEEMAADLERLERNAVTEAARHHVVLPSEQAASTTHINQAIAPATEVIAPSTTMYEANGALSNDSEPQKSNRALKTIAALLAVVVLVIAGFFSYDFFSENGFSRSVVTLPNLVGETQSDAVTELEHLGLQVTVNNEPNPNIERGEVVRSNPASGSRVQKGSTVTITVSSGREVTEVPDLTGKTIAEAADVLKNAGLELESQVRESSSDVIEEGKIVEQTPSGGSQVSRGSKVVITVSTGEATQRVPVISGMQWSQAQGNLTALHFEPIVEYVDSSEPEGTVVSVESEGAQKKEGSTVRVQVSNAMLITMPNITRLDPTAAQAALESLGWHGHLVTGETVKTAALVDRGLIGAQDPASGAKVRKDATITIRVYEFDLTVIGQ